MSERFTKGSEHDYHPINQYIDEQSNLRKARSFWIKAKSWALILIAIGILMVLLAWAYSLLHKHYILKKVAVVQERVIEEKINEAISSGGISKSVNKIKMLGDNQIAIEKLNETEKALENEINKNKDLAKEIDNTAIQMNKAAQELEKSVGKIESFESEKLALLKQQQELENQVDELKEEGEEREQTIKKLEEIKEKNNELNTFYRGYSELTTPSLETGITDIDTSINNTRLAELIKSELHTNNTITLVKDTESISSLFHFKIIGREKFELISLETKNNNIIQLSIPLPIPK